MIPLLPCQAALSEYIREGMTALGDPYRQDQGRILEELRFLYRSYGQKYKKISDWVPSGTRGRCAPGEQ